MLLYGRLDFWGASGGNRGTGGRRSFGRVALNAAVKLNCKHLLDSSVPFEQYDRRRRRRRRRGGGGGGEGRRRDERTRGVLFLGHMGVEKCSDTSEIPYATGQASDLHIQKHSMVVGAPAIGRSDRHLTLYWLLWTFDLIPSPSTRPYQVFTEFYCVPHPTFLKVFTM